MQFLLKRIGTISDTTKKHAFGTTFLKKALPGIYFQI